VVARGEDEGKLILRSNGPSRDSVSILAPSGGVEIVSGQQAHVPSPFRLKLARFALWACFACLSDSCNVSDRALVYKPKLILLFI